MREDILKNKLLKIFFMILVVFLVNSVAYAAEYKIENYDMNVTLKENGDIHVEELLTYDFNAKMNGLYRILLYKYTYDSQSQGIEATSSRYQGDAIQNVYVYTSNTGFSNMSQSYVKDESLLSNGMSGYHSIQSVVSDGNGKKIKVYSPVNSGDHKYVKYEYDITNVGVTYNDASEVYWNYIGGDWECKIDNFNLNIKLENGGSCSTAKVYPHSYANIIETKILNDSINIKAQNISSHTALDARVIFDSKVINNTHKTYTVDYPYDNLETIEAYETKQKEDYILSNKIYILTIVIAIVGSIITIYIVKKYKKSKYNKDNNIEYYRDIPDTYSLFEYATIYDKLENFGTNKLLVATIMDLSERKYILLEPEKNTEKTISNNSDYNYYVTLKVNVDEVNLNEYEKYVIEYIFESTKISEKTTRIDLNKRFKEIGKSYSNSMNYYKKMQSLKNECINRFYDKVPSKIQRIGILQMVVVLLLLIINTAFISPLTIMTRISLGIVVVIAACFYYGILLTSISSTRILKDSIIEEYNKINGLKKYLTDYSVIKERYPIEIKLWGKYLVFATIFGIADKVQKEFKEELIKQGYNEETINTNYTSLIIASHCSEFYKMTIISTGSSSSGGYSGGGSGGGGGGGGRRRRILKT